MVIVFDKNKYKPIETTEKESKSTFAKWLVSIKIVKTDSQGEKLSIFLIFLIFLISGIIYSLGVGTSKIKDLEEGKSEYIK